MTDLVGEEAAARPPFFYLMARDGRRTQRVRQATCADTKKLAKPNPLYRHDVARRALRSLSSTAETG